MTIPDVAHKATNNTRTSYGTPAEVFFAFLKLGLTSFGGPIAHLGYFREELVVRRRWVNEQGYADLVALCQFLPGPASSQVGFALGFLRAGPLGAAAAWLAFTMPSAILLIAFASLAGLFDGPVGQGLIHGLKLVAVAIVAQAIWGMAKSLTPDRPRAAIALFAILIAVLAPTALGQILAIAFGTIAGFWFCRTDTAQQPVQLAFNITKRVGVTCLILFFGLLFGLPLLAGPSGWQPLKLIDVFYRSGALVFGGGHVVLPLLETEVVRTGWVSTNDFLAGYGAAQAVPGPLFTFASYLGFAMTPEPNGLIGAMICLIVIFVPGFLLLAGAIPFWNALRHQSWAQAGLKGTNAAVVGILGAAFYNPVWTSAVLSPIDFAIAVIGFVALVVWKAPSWLMVVAVTIAGLAGKLLIGP
ncbi:chromate efflux transporter [Enterovirga rhinocerotis]|uniref:Chromate transporter n=1 Tax=Enterovirga rhinocerotis TaxID=1339210 RepID=A0A4R7C6H8_9HYPH|nr:chromate efflux transporter [Enterovirga rhinocerotis]TDR94184.1 chromate transporter [Enterovirga rhinocerotis]